MLGRFIIYNPYRIFYVLAVNTNRKANTLESFIEVDKTLNKLKINDLVKDTIDGGDEYLIP